MKGLLQHLKLSLVLYARNKMALLYNYLFPVIFFAAFLVLYRYEKPKLILHMGELLTVSILGGACFGLPTSMVSDRERGVWRRYRLAPITTGSLVVSTLLARYVTVLCAGLIQLALGMIVGHWVPEHPFDLFVAFTLVTFAFLGLGLVIATLADTVPAVQALGQCIFLPMLIIGGVAVKLSTLPDWALHVSAFFPGRYAVETMQECVKGDGLGHMGFNLFALLLIGLAGCLAGAKLFRWDAQQHFMSGSNKAWLGVALVAWAVVGIGAEIRREITPLAVRRHPVAVESVAPPSTQELVSATATLLTTNIQQIPTNISASVIASTPAVTMTNTNTVATSSVVSMVVTNMAKTNKVEESWRTMTTNDFAKFDYEGLPPDEGSVAPIAPEKEEVYPDFADTLVKVGDQLQKWAPGKVADPVQRVRNLIYVAGTVDEERHPLERFMPGVILEILKQDFRDEQLAQILAWIAKNPDQGDDAAIDDMDSLGLQMGMPNKDEVRMRTYFYALKFLHRIITK